MTCANATATLAWALGYLTQEDWETLRKASTADRQWHQREWWHNKYYVDNPPNDRNAVQQPTKGEPEIPQKRKLFYPSPFSRFSLGEKGDVAYFSCDFGVNCCETIEHFSTNPQLNFEELSIYLRGDSNPKPGLYGFPLNFYLDPAALILNVAEPKAPFFRALSRQAGLSTETAMRILVSREDECKRSTQEISLAARQFGFDGLVYRSVRAPVDVSMPEWNLVMFSPANLRKGMPPKTESRTGACRRI